MTNQKIEIEATISADPSKVWECWTSPEHITQWNFAIAEWCCPKVTNDLRPGGTYQARMEARDGSFGFDFEAVYDEVLKGEKIVYTMTDGRKAITNFKKVGSNTKVNTVFDAEKTNPLEMQKSGWQAILDNFKRYVESR
ncbi:MAG: SRPBCC family protein [Proteobacteria bacterium]|nr:SRPBCC family protein [Pseudomonadota bacterium]